MLSNIGVVAAPNNEDVVRLFLILNNIVGMSMSFIGLRAAYVVLGTIMGVSLLFNLAVILSQSRERRNKLKNNEVVQPNLVSLSIDIFAVGAFLIMYIVSVIDSLVLDGTYYWGSASTMFVHAYAGVPGLIACIMHAYLATKGTACYLKYRASFAHRCPNCKRDFDVAPVLLPENPSPVALSSCNTQSPRVSFTANTIGEGESDNLIMKE